MNNAKALADAAAAKTAAANTGANASAISASGASPSASARSAEVLMIGCGKMGGALLERWTGALTIPFTAVSPSGERRLPEGVAMVRAAEELDDRRFGALIIAVKPQMVAGVLPAYLPLLADDGVIISMAAGTSCAALRALAPEHPIIRIMPNLPVSIGRGVSGVYADGDTTPAHRGFTATLMAPTGRVVWVDSEDQLDRVTAIAGSGPGFAFETLRAWTAAAAGLGFDEQDARSWVLEVMRGAVELAIARGVDLAELRNEVTSLKGTTAAGLEALNGDAALDDRYRETLAAAYERAVELR
ncbi:MAG: pyrroline-5-carboxylate reductase dimerization domain-containing protein [Halieaceae bacterium]|jgi:pyrroline-5-carboxylate reductase|nr:pyrroline-5-carboxylate reductase dimerization domain-containing protein [Halieaceae bacterium]